MTKSLISRPLLLLLDFLLCCSLVGCSKRDDKTLSAADAHRTTSTNEAVQDTVGEPEMENRPKHGFKEYVKNPELLRQESEEMAKDESAATATPRELAALVSAMGRRPLERAEIIKLRNAGEKAAPLLEAALRDEKFLFHRYGKSVLDGSPIETALDLLEPFRLPELSVLKSALRHPDEFFRQHALYHLARCGNDEAINALVAGLKSESEPCRTWTLMGLEFLKRTSRGSKKFRATLFEAVVPVLGDKEYGPAEHAPRALLVLDAEHAKSVLLGADVFRGENRRVNEVLKALRDAEVPVPASQLRKLLADIKGKATKYPFDYAYADGLILLARAEGARVKDLIDDAQSWGNDEVKKGAAKALGIAAGVIDAYGYVMDLYERKGVNGLTEPQLYYLTLFWLDAEVRNGGFSQYYFNSSGEMSLYAVKAARTVGAPELAKIIQNANDFYGKDGPSPDRNKRMKQLSKIDLDALGKLDTRYYKCPEQLGELLPKFVASNSEAFKPAK